MTDRRFIRDLGALSGDPGAIRVNALETPKARGPLDGVTALVRPGAPSSTGGSGIASPLTEGDAASREYWPAQTVTSSDGIFTFEIYNLKTWVLTDANGRAVRIQPADPAP